MTPRAWLLTLAILAPGAPAQAELVIGGPPAFVAQVRTCLELFSAADQETRETVDSLLQPAPAGERHEVFQGELGGLAVTSPTNPDQGHLQPGGGNGRGSGTSIMMSPTIDAAEFCAILLHEFKHASDFDNGADRGSQRPRPQPGAGIPDAEIDAMREENRYRKHAGLPQDLDSGGIPLPPDAVFN